MVSLNTLVRGGGRRGAGYKPFTQPPYSGRYPIGPRGLSTTANAPFRGVANANALYALRARSPLYLYEDRRLWHPEGAWAVPRSKTQTYPRMYDPLPIAPIEPDPFRKRKREPSPFRFPYHEIYRRPKPPSYYDLPVVSWSRPLDMVICLKRKMRREVIHAVRAVLGPKFRPRAPRMTQWSFVRCS